MGQEVWSLEFDVIRCGADAAGKWIVRGPWFIRAITAEDWLGKGVKITYAADDYVGYENVCCSEEHIFATEAEAIAERDRLSLAK
jgi:hypothetical protein